MSLILITSERFADHQTPPGHPERPERAEVMEVVAREWARQGGAVVSFIVKGERAGAFKVIDSTRICSITANLVDGRRIFVEASAAWPFAAITQAAHRLGESTGGSVRSRLGRPNRSHVLVT